MKYKFNRDCALVCAFILGIMVMLGMNSNVCAKESNEEGIANETENRQRIEEYEKIMLLQENAVMANECINQMFETDENGMIIYPNEYAGAWIDENMLVLALTNVEDEVISKYIDFAGEYANYVRFEKAEFSYNYLKTVEENVVQTLVEEENVNVVNHYVSDITNSIVIGIDGEDANNRAMLCMDFESEVDVPIVYEISTETNTMTTSLYGGEALRNSSAACNLTLGCCGAYNNAFAIVSCGHGEQAKGDVIKYQKETGEVIGTVSYIRYENNQYGDFEFITVNSNFNTTNKIKPNNSISGTLSNPAVNTVLRYYGKSTGYVSYGTVKNRDVTVHADNEKYIKGLSTIKLTYGECNPGDSGAPFFQTASSGVNFCGILHGSNEKDGNVYVYFTPYTYISSAGFVVRKN